MANIRDVANHARVSPSTVSRVLSGNAFVEPETKNRVLRAIKDLNYRPNLAARSLKQGNSKLIGLIIPDITNPYYPELVKSIGLVAGRAGYSMVLCEALGSIEKEKQFFKALMNLFVDGIIYIASTNEIEHVKPYISKIPLVFLNRFFEVDVPCININNEKAAYEAINYLVERGHKKISILINNTKHQYNQERLRGAVRSLTEHSIVDYERYLVRGIDSIDDVYEKTTKLLESNNKPTAIFIFNDYLSPGVYKAVNKRGLRIPEDISVMGFDDTPQVRYLSPSLTTVRHPSADHAQFIFDVLMKERNSSGTQNNVTYFDGIIIERESVKTIEEN